MYDLRRKSIKDDAEDTNTAKKHKKSIKNALSLLQTQLKRKEVPSVEPSIEITQGVPPSPTEEPPRKRRGRPSKPKNLPIASPSLDSPSEVSTPSPVSSASASPSPSVVAISTPIKEKSHRRGRKPKNPKPVLMTSGENPDEMGRQEEKIVEEIIPTKDFTSPVSSASFGMNSSPSPISVKNLFLISESPPISPTRVGSDSRKSLEEELFSVEGLLARSERIDNATTWSWGLIEEVEREESLTYQESKERLFEEEERMEAEERALDFMLKESPLALCEKEEPLDEIIDTWLL
eukprot:TRINITY_DN4945_c0_g1_i5.p1 TRINITY_DN4945_c0_g1~~TRINITY_DN4945_c0_g1_i5.p1  ORF type:complete len:292 (+),score=119.15 TRINITY_DN4945_c0_g1_i5:475-1350(+)